jgi:hypothetical protein
MHIDCNMIEWVFVACVRPVDIHGMTLDLTLSTLTQHTQRSVLGGIYADLSERRLGTPTTNPEFNHKISQCVDVDAGHISSSFGQVVTDILKHRLEF